MSPLVTLVNVVQYSQKGYLPCFDPTSDFTSATNLPRREVYILRRICALQGKRLSLADCVAGIMLGTLADQAGNMQTIGRKVDEMTRYLSTEVLDRSLSMKRRYAVSEWLLGALLKSPPPEISLSLTSSRV